MIKSFWEVPIHTKTTPSVLILGTIEEGLRRLPSGLSGPAAIK